jgi:hypothetical protein
MEEKKGNKMEPPIVMYALLAVFGAYDLPNIVVRYGKRRSR